jgi:hypothetical protein
MQYTHHAEQIKVLRAKITALQDCPDPVTPQEQVRAAASTPDSSAIQDASPATDDKKPCRQGRGGNIAKLASEEHCLSYQHFGNLANRCFA